MCVCMCVCVCASISLSPSHTHTFTRAHRYIDIYIYAFVCVYMFGCMNICSIRAISMYSTSWQNIISSMHGTFMYLRSSLVSTLM